MARAYAATLGTTAFAVLALRAVARGDMVTEMMGHGLQAMIVFAVIGYGVGATCDRLIRQSLEAQFRAAVDQYSRELAERIARKGGAHK